MTDPALAFDLAFAKRAPQLGIRAEHEDDLSFSDALFIRTAMGLGMLPAAMHAEQARLRRIGHRAAFPHAVRRIVTDAGRPIGRIVIDWAATTTRCVDIAVLPERQGQGIGGALLRAWLEVADTARLPAALTVARVNPAAALYDRLGLVQGPRADAQSPDIELLRPPPERRRSRAP